MNTTTKPVEFGYGPLLDWLHTRSDAALDELPFGVIGFDHDHRVRRYNRTESTLAHFPAHEVMGQHVFVELAPCLNNYLVAGRFEEAKESSQGLDITMPYVLTFRMRPTRVRMRLLAAPDQALRYILIDRLPGGAT